MKLNNILSVILMFSFSVANAEDTSSMHMMGNEFNKQLNKTQDIAQKMESETSSDKRSQYMRSHMSNLKDMMSMMGNIMSNDQKSVMMLKQVSDCQGMQAGKMMDDKEMAGAKEQGGMMMGGMMQMMGGLAERNDMFEQRMKMMQGMMDQMIKHMSQMEIK
ncbi:MAG: hypothetical protein OEY43_02420 [Gammaproteobacteria bacterium]|nr:hypothetical protein [Gammaproteobacteria bacterium]